MHGSTLRRRAVPGALLLCSALAIMAGGAGSAFAGEARVEGNVVVYDAFAGEANRVELVQQSELGLTNVFIRDTVPTLQRGADCAPTEASTIVKCTVVGSAKVRLDLGNGNDTVAPDFVTVSTAFGPLDSPLEVNGGPGIDTVTGTPKGDTLNGGDGDDNLHGAAGSDNLSGNVGQDALDAGPGNDDANGGIGGDVLDGFAGEDELLGGDGDDVLRGGLDDDAVHGNGGNDTVNGGAGEDTMTGGTEADAMNSTDGAADAVDCGGNLFAKDSADIDAFDSAVNCEKVF